MKTKLTPAIKKQFLELQNQLSPENLKDRHKEIMIKWWALEDKIGTTVNAETIEQWERVKETKKSV